MRSDDYQFSALFVRYFENRFVRMTNSDFNPYLDAGGFSKSLQFLQRGLHGLFKDATRQLNGCPAWNVFHHIEQNDLEVAVIVARSVINQGIDFCSISQVDCNKDGLFQRGSSSNRMKRANSPTIR